MSTLHLCSNHLGWACTGWKAGLGMDSLSPLPSLSVSPLILTQHQTKPKGALPCLSILPSICKLACFLAFPFLWLSTWAFAGMHISPAPPPHPQSPLFVVLHFAGTSCSLPLFLNLLSTVCRWRKWALPQRKAWPTSTRPSLTLFFLNSP